MVREEKARAGGHVRAPAAAFVDGFGILLGIFFLTFRIKKRKKKVGQVILGNPAHKECSN